MGLKNLQDFLAGLLFVVFGAAALWFGKSYAIGVATRMGPGFMPTLLGWALVGVGTFITVRALVVAGVGIPAINLRPQVMIIAALMAFAFTVERFGLLVAAGAVVILGSLASKDVRFFEMIALAVITAFASVGLFIYLLGQPMAPWTWGF